MNTYSHELQSAKSIARQAGKHILRERGRHMEILLKAPNDLVTNVDRSTEELIINELRRAYPGDQIVGEEYGESVQGAAQSERRWIIDPIDGTINFAMGLPLFCVSIGFQVAGKSVAGAIYDPVGDELFSAALGQGAHLNGLPISVSECETLDTSVLVTGFPRARTEEFEATARQFIELTRTCRGVRRLGSAALDLAYVASGRLDGFWEYGLNPWDTAAGYLLVNEAGGKITDLSGAPFAIDAPNILATNKNIHDELLTKLNTMS